MTGASQWEIGFQEADAFIFAVAVDADADLFIIRDGHFLRNEILRAKSGITIISPSDYIICQGSDPEAELLWQLILVKLAEIKSCGVCVEQVMSLTIPTPEIQDSGHEPHECA